MEEDRIVDHDLVVMFASWTDVVKKVLFLARWSFEKFLLIVLVNFTKDNICSAWLQTWRDYIHIDKLQLNIFVSVLKRLLDDFVLDKINKLYCVVCFLRLLISSVSLNEINLRCLTDILTGLILLWHFCCSFFGILNLFV